MKLAFLMFTFIWGSMSLRSPHVENCVRDYEIAFGLENQHYMIDMLMEREDGLYYRGGRLNLKPTNWIELNYMVKEARQIDTESLMFLYQPFKSWKLGFRNLYIGGSANMMSWKDARYLLAISYRGKNTKLCYETNFTDRIIIALKIGFDIPMGKGFVTQMFHKYESVNDNNFDQEKMVIGWRKKE